MSWILALIGLICGAHIAAAAESRFEAWQLRCDPRCLITQEISNRNYRLKAEVSFVGEKIMMRILLPSGAGSWQNIALATNGRNQGTTPVRCLPDACESYFELTEDYLASTVGDLYLIVDFGVNEREGYRAGFNLPGLHAAIDAARTR